MVETRQPDGAPSFVERLDAFEARREAGFALPPVMIYGDDVTHVITEEGIANLLLCRGGLYQPPSPLPQLVRREAGMETLHFAFDRRPRAGAVRAGAGGRRRVGQS
jgi:hypothetical protein